jgi:hypothetical protein
LSTNKKVDLKCTHGEEGTRLAHQLKVVENSAVDLRPGVSPVTLTFIV